MPAPEGELTEPPESSDEEQAELDDDAQESRSLLDERLGQSIDAVTNTIKPELQKLEVRTFKSESLDNRPRYRGKGTRGALEVSRDGTPSTELDEYTKRADAVVDRNGSDPGGDESKNKKASFNGKRWLAFIGIAVITGLGILFEEMYRAANKKPDQDVPLDEATKEAIRQMVQKWSALDDKTFWGNLADYVGKNAFTLADMVYFMQYVQQFFPLSTPFFWDRLQDKADLVDELVDTWQGSNGSQAAVLALMPFLTYRQQPLPRNIQAGVGELAFASVIPQP